MPEIVAQRMFQPIYILLDSVFLVALCAMLFFRRRYLTLLFGLFGGILYFVVCSSGRVQSRAAVFFGCCCGCL